MVAAMIGAAAPSVATIAKIKATNFEGVGVLEYDITSTQNKVSVQEVKSRF